MKNLTSANLLNVTVAGTSSAGMACLWLWDTSAKSLILLTLGAAACCLLTRASAATRHWIWATTLLGLIVMPAGTLLLPEWRILPSWLSIESRFEEARGGEKPNSKLLPISADSASLAAHSAEAFRATPLPVSRLPVLEPEGQEISAAPADYWPVAIRVSADLLLAVWGAGVLLLLAPIATAFMRLIRLERLSKSEGSMSQNVLKRIAKAAKDVGVNSPRVIVGPLDSMPMVWSFFGGRLFLPCDCERWSEARWNAVIHHELIHLRRRDPMMFSIALVARAMNWFNPLAWYAVHRLRIECERACDDHVLRLGIDASEYAEHLLQFSTGSHLARGTSSLAFAMATRPNIEHRIVAILDDKLNRHGVTVRRAAALLLFVSCNVALLATLRASVTSESTVADEKEVEIKYPYCVVEDQVKPRSLADAVAAFNLEAKQSPTGVVQRPISEPETLAAIAKSLNEPSLNESLKTVLSEIVNTKTLPEKAYFRRFTRFDDEQQMHGVWWVRLCIEGDNPVLYSVPVRTTHLYARPYSQLERQQNSEQGVTLINRRSSYFEEPPTIQLGEELPQPAVAQLITSMKKGLADKSTDDLKALFDWDGAVLPEFAESELQMLINATVHSMKVEPVRLSGNLLHWSGFRFYRPNLPVVGYIEIEYTQANDPVESRKKISLELGMTEDKFRLVNYVAEEPKFPAALNRISITGHTERLADGVFQVTSMIRNPGELISAHLANEEVWHRDYEHKRKPNQSADNANAKEANNNSKAIALRSISAVEAANFLEQLYRGRVERTPGFTGLLSIVPDARTNSLSITAHPDDIERIEALIKQMDEKHLVPVNRGIVCKEIALVTLDVKELVKKLTQFFGGKAGGRVETFGQDDLLPTPQGFMDAFAVGGQPSISGPKVGIVADCLTNSAWVFALPEDIAKIEAFVEKRTDAVRDFRSDELMAIVGTESIFAGEMMVFIDPILEKTRDSLPVGQEKWLRSILIRDALPQYVTIKALYQEFFRDMVGNKSPEKFEEMKAKVLTKAAQIFHDKQLPLTMRKYKVNDLAALEHVLEEESLTLSALRTQFIERVLSLELERKFVPEEFDFSREELLAYYHAHEEEWLEGEPPRAKAFNIVEASVRAKLADEKRKAKLDALHAKVLAQTQIWTLWPADIPNSRPLAEHKTSKQPDLKVERFYKSRKIRLVEASSGDPIARVKIRVQYSSNNNAEKLKSVELTSDAQGIVEFELADDVTIDFEVVSNEWWQIGQVRFVVNGAWNTDDKSTKRYFVPPPSEIKLNRGQPADSIVPSTIVR